MTMIREVQLACTKCNHNFQDKLYLTINITLDPQLLRKIYDGEINVVECPNCHIKSFVDINLLFHDMEYIVKENGKMVKKSYMLDVKEGQWNWLIWKLDKEGYFNKFKKEKNEK